MYNIYAVINNKIVYLTQIWSRMYLLFILSHKKCTPVCAVKPAYEVTSIKQSPELKGYLFLVLS